MKTIYKKEKTIIILFILLLLCDLIFSFLQYYYSPLHGDIENGVLPNSEVQEIINDPFGINTIKTGNFHPNPNRFFSHYAFMKYFQNVPIWLQELINPITSVYLSGAIAKIIIQILFICFLSIFISGGKKILKKDFLLAAILITPLFQVYGYWSRMGIVDKSIAYTFFYGLPLTLLIIFYIPIFKNLLYGYRIKSIYYLLLIPLSIILPFSGPLIPGVILIICLLVFGGRIFYYNPKISFNIKNIFKTVPIPIILLLIFVSVLSAYSLYLGKFDSNYLSDSIPLLERYSKLPSGIYSQVFHSLGFPLVLIIIGLNVYIIKTRIHISESAKILTVLKWIGIFILIYILLLPLGGYRPYRPEIIRYDTFMPITAALIFFFGYSTFFILKHFASKNRNYYVVTIAISLLIFTFSDTSGIHKNACEKKSLEIIANSPDKIVKIQTDCKVFSWSYITDYRLTELKGELLYKWNITSEKKLYYLEKNVKE
ncbi:MAG: hypothetical protein HQ541_12060 [Mariniphaga sp.]|nr:hypothetical protein [Mariniphaga sp.]